MKENGAAREYVYYPGTRCPLAVIEDTGHVYYYHNDINGLPQELTRSNGEIVWSACYDEFARIEEVQVDEVTQPLRLIGQYFDSSTALCYDGQRYFESQAYMFISPNLLGPMVGEHPYTYAPNVWSCCPIMALSKVMSRTFLDRIYAPNSESFLGDLSKMYPIPESNTLSSIAFSKSRMFSNMFSLKEKLPFFITKPATAQALLNPSWRACTGERWRPTWP